MEGLVEGDLGFAPDSSQVVPERRGGTWFIVLSLFSILESHNPNIFRKTFIG
jgi:hypothetical protein